MPRQSVSGEAKTPPPKLTTHLVIAVPCYVMWTDLNGKPPLTAFNSPHYAHITAVDTRVLFLASVGMPRHLHLVYTPSPLRDHRELACSTRPAVSSLALFPAESENGSFKACSPVPGSLSGVDGHAGLHICIFGPFFTTGATSNATQQGFGYSAGVPLPTCPTRPRSSVLGDGGPNAQHRS